MVARKQLTGEGAGRRSGHFSRSGIILYEDGDGRAAVPKGSVAEVTSSILRDAPPPVVRASARSSRSARDGSSDAAGEGLPGGATSRRWTFARAWRKCARNRGAGRASGGAPHETSRAGARGDPRRARPRKGLYAAAGAVVRRGDRRPGLALWVRGRDGTARLHGGPRRPCRAPSPPPVR